MAVLNSWQKLDRVIAGKPWGDGSDGAYSSATIPTLTVDSCSGTATSTTLTTSGSTFANGDVLLIHQTRGTGVGQWEINKVSSGGGTASLTLQVALKYTYTDSGASQAQATKIKQYTNVTVQSGTWTITDWAGNTGGTLVFAANGAVTVTGTVSGSGKGFVGGARDGDPGTSTSGEGGSANPGSQATGAGQAAVNSEAGYGGGYGVAGGGSKGGSIYGSADLTVFTFGGGGSGANANPSTNASNGADSGGASLIFAKDITVTGAISMTGSNSGSAADRSGGGGSGGATLIVCETANLGTTKVTALGGSPGSATAQGTAGGAGRIAVHHSGSISGTTNPTFEDTTDSSLVETEADTNSYSFFM